MTDELTHNSPPAEEPAGYCAAPGFVKSRPENNDYYIEQFSGDPWYPILKRTHEYIERLAPGYNIVQIKAKFGELRYYYDLPADLGLNDEESKERITGRVRELVRYAEAWVDGFEYARNKKENS